MIAEKSKKSADGTDPYTLLETEKRKVELLQLEKQFRVQKEKQLNFEIEELHKLVRAKEGKVNEQETKEKEAKEGKILVFYIF